VCSEHDARPPELSADLRLPALAGAAGVEHLTLTSADGTQVAAALAIGPADATTGVVILPDAGSLRGFYEELAERFAAAGHPAIAVDYYARTAGPPPRSADFNPMEHLQQTQLPTLQADFAAAAEALRERSGVESVVIAGFCFGGTNAFLAAAAAELDVAGVIGFHGGLDGGMLGLPNPVDVVRDMRCPVLGLFGTADEWIPVEQVEEFERALERDGVPYEIQLYEGAPHSFFDRVYEEHTEACADAWRRTLDFVGRAPAAVV
jgi:carboxymethylenebutenolidase